MPLVGGLARPLLRHHLRLGLDAARRHRLRDDLARARRARGVELADPARLLRRRGRHHRQPHAGCSASSTVNFGSQIQVYYLIAAWCLLCIDRDVRAHPHAVRPHVQRGARQSRARASSSATAARWCASSPSASRASSPASRAGSRPSISRSSMQRYVGAAAVRRRAARWPLSAASAHFVGPVARRDPGDLPAGRC